MSEENRGPVWVARVRVVEAAEAYEAAWNAHMQGAGTMAEQMQLQRARTDAHQDLLNAVRALKERRG